MNFPLRQFLLLACLAASLPSAVSAAEICPARSGQFPRYLSVFDGPPEEMADLVPDTDSAGSSFWDLAYVYDAGRIVTIRCKYADGTIADMPLPDRIKRCRYKPGPNRTARVFCQ